MSGQKKKKKKELNIIVKPVDPFVALKIKSVKRFSYTLKYSFVSDSNYF